MLRLRCGFIAHITACRAICHTRAVPGHLPQLHLGTSLKPAVTTAALRMFRRSTTTHPHRPLKVRMPTPTLPSSLYLTRSLPTSLTRRRALPHLHLYRRLSTNTSDKQPPYQVESMILQACSYLTSQTTAPRTSMRVAPRTREMGTPTWPRSPTRPTAGVPRSLPPIAFFSSYPSDCGGRQI